VIFSLNRDRSRQLIEGLTEAAIIVRGASVTLSNKAARNLLGVAIEGVDVRQVLPHPAVIERLIRGRVTARRKSKRGLWRIAPAVAGPDRPSAMAHLVRLIDRSEARAAEADARGFRRQCQPRAANPALDADRYTENASRADRRARRRHAGAFLSIVHDEARRMQRVVEDLISLSRIEAEKFTTPTEAVDLEQLIESPSRGAKRMAEERGSELVMRDRPDFRRSPQIGAESFRFSTISSPTPCAMRAGHPRDRIGDARGRDGARFRR
jgi:two-component system phosphate regulon sensor histidine kinase PhoR